jgi:transcriptional regulator with XRE-family HTH domain
VYNNVQKGGEKRMSNIGNKETMAKNLQYYVERSGRTQKELAEIVGVAASTFNDWMKGKKYPRIDKIEMLANYFHILKSDLIEEKTEEHREMQKNNDIITDVIVRMRSDNEFLSVVGGLLTLDADKMSAVKQLLLVLQK